MLFPFLAAIINVFDIISEKSFFDHKRKKYRVFVPFLFLFTFIIVSIFFYPFWGQVKKEAFEIIPLFILVAVVVLACFGNMLYYSGFQREGLSEIEPLTAFGPLLTILIAGIFYPDERNWKIFILALIAALALISSHIEKKHLRFDKGLIPISVAVFLGAIEINLVKELLYYYSPVALYTIRVGLVALALFLFIRPNIKDIIYKEFKYLLPISFMWVLVMVFVYSGYQQLGIIYTVLILMLTPVLVVAGSYLVLKEKRIRKKDIVALVTVVICVVLAQFIK